MGAQYIEKIALKMENKVFAVKYMHLGSHFLSSNKHNSERCMFYVWEVRAPK